MRIVPFDCIQNNSTRRGQGGETCCRFVDFLSEGRASHFSDKILRSNFGPNFFRQISNNFSWFIIWVPKVSTKIGHFSNKTKNGQIWLPKFECWKVIDICWQTFCWQNVEVYTHAMAGKCPIFVDEIFVCKMSKLDVMETPEYVKNLLTKEIVI